jgi:hypothetical protein
LPLELPEPLDPLTPEPVSAEPLEPPPYPPLVEVVGEPEVLAPARSPPDSLADDADELAPAEELLSRLRNAVTSPPVDTMPATDHPSAAFSVSFVARAAGS